MATATQGGDLIVDLVGDRGIDWAVETVPIRAQDIVSHIIIIVTRWWACVVCPVCLTEHNVETVTVTETWQQDGREIPYDATYKYCDVVDLHFETEELLKANIDTCRRMGFF